MKNETPDKHPCQICRHPAKLRAVEIPTVEGPQVALLCRVCRRLLTRQVLKMLAATTEVGQVKGEPHPSERIVDVGTENRLR
jgi:hypothetical protein